jgi:hypothetical protein
MPRTRKGLKEQANQSKAFIEAARKIGCDEDPAHFDEILKKVARHKPGNRTAANKVNENETKKPTK